MDALKRRFGSWRARAVASAVVSGLGLGLADTATATCPPAPGVRIVWVGAVLAADPPDLDRAAQRHPSPGAWPAIEPGALGAPAADASRAASDQVGHDVLEVDLRGRRLPSRR